MTDAYAATTTRLLAEAISGGLFRGVWGLKVTGLELVPRSGPVIFAGNHTSMIDPPLLCCALSETRFPKGMGKKELFKNRLLAWFLLELGGFPVDRGGADLSALRGALEILEKGGSLMIFPEGTRVRPGETRPPKAGVSFLSSKGRAPVVPTRLIGAGTFPKTFPLEVRFGAPIPPPAEGDRDEAKNFAKRVMDAVYAL